MSQDDKKALVPRPGSEIARPSNRRNPVISRMSRDLLARAQAQELRAARFRIGEYELREPDYKQVLQWAESLGITPEAVLVELGMCRIEPTPLEKVEPIAFRVADGAITSLAWDFEYLPQCPEPWQSDLVIQMLGLEGGWRVGGESLPHVTNLRLTFGKLNTLRCSGLVLLCQI
jgi:hypothetical protein